ncbi:MAG: DinB family protein [Gemmatimonadetes bacterium]|nr:DinB family protein [Gemmatimonadota bacterium]
MTGIEPIASLLRLNSRLFINCLDGITDEQAAIRPGPRTNSLGYVACHVLDARHFLAAYVGLSEPNPFAELLRDVRSIEDVTSLPRVAEIVAAWRRLAPTLEQCVAGLGRDELAAVSPQPFPVDQSSVLGGIAFLVQHEA